MRCFFIGCAGFVVAAIVTMVAVSAYGDYAARASLSETIAATGPLREKIAEMIMTQRADARAGTSLTPLGELQPVPGADYVKIAPDGTIVFRSAKHGQIIVFEPSVRENVVSWRCIGSKPEKNIPPNCR